MTWVRNPEVRRRFILGALWLFVALLLVGFADVLLPFGVALLLAFVLEPAVETVAQRPLGRHRWGRPAALASIYVVTFVVIASASVWALAQIGREFVGIGRLTPVLIEQMKVGIGALLDWSERFALENSLPIDRTEIETVLQQNLVNAVEDFSQSARDLLSLGRDVLTGAFRTVFGAVLVLMLAAFMSIDRFRIERFFRSMVPPDGRSTYDVIIHGMSTGLSGVVRGQVLICLTNGVLTFVGLWLLEVKLPLILATIATIFSLIPIFGSILSTIPIVALALVDGFAKALFALLWIIGIHLLEGNVLNPKIMGDSAKIHPVLVVFALMVGERTGGLVGALFAVPVAAVVLTVFQFLHRVAIEGIPETMDLPAPRVESEPIGSGSSRVEPARRG